MKYVETLIKQLGGLFGAKHLEGVETEHELSAKLDDLQPVGEMVKGITTLQETITSLETKLSDAVTANIEMSATIKTMTENIASLQESLKTNQSNYDTSMNEVNTRIDEIAKAQLKASTSENGGVPGSVGFIEKPTSKTNPNIGGAIPKI